MPAHRQNPVSHQICNNTLQLRLHRCLMCFNGMSEERTDYADLICTTEPEKPQRELLFPRDRARVSLSFCHFFFINPALNVSDKDLQRNFSRDIRAGWGHTMFQSTSRDDVCRWTKWFHLLAQWTVLLLDHWLRRAFTQDRECTLKMLVFLLLYITPGNKKKQQDGLHFSVNCSFWRPGCTVGYRIITKSILNFVPFSWLSFHSLS